MTADLQKLVPDIKLPARVVTLRFPDKVEKSLRAAGVTKQSSEVLLGV
jgi:hypothetical protein